MRKKIIILTLFILFSFSKRTPSRIIEVTSWNDRTKLGHTHPPTPSEISQSWLNHLKFDFNMARDHTTSGLQDFFTSINMTDARFFSPQFYHAYSPAYARFAGLFTNMTEQEFVLNTQNLTLFPIVGDQYYKFHTISLEGGFENIFRILEGSMILEASSARGCRYTNNLKDQNKGDVSEIVKLACDKFIDSKVIQTKLNSEELLDAYLLMGNQLSDDIQKEDVEKCLEYYIISVYYSNDIQIKQNSGLLIERIFKILTSKSEEPKFQYYAVDEGVFFGLMSALQVVMRLNDEQYNKTKPIFWGALRDHGYLLSFNEYEPVEEGGKRSVQTILFSPHGEILFSIELSVEDFIHSFNPFGVSGYEDFRHTCQMGYQQSMDVADILLGKEIPPPSYQKLGLLILTLLSGLLCIYRFFAKSSYEEDDGEKITNTEFRVLNQYDQQEDDDDIDLDKEKSH